ncbi:DUF2247 family protein [Cellulomonas chengniuliangii]|uniref:DUF2247 family protein n=1 Tax=Cellulomonas chengniuliangii TaxID=2968084 RepID=UPI001D0EC3B1|nr:DUF2247 family protein [Cellulomonas chengniuliangii]MCC2319266.1 DUF2247 family protein [Cellulomonas chengniuliangii]
MKFRLPASFVLDRVTLRPNELAYGYTHGWLDDSAVVRIAERMLVDDQRILPPVEGLALLLSAESWRVPELVDEINDNVEGDVGRVWLYLALDWLSEHRGEFSDPYEVIEMLYADFDYPPEIEGIVRFMPSPLGAATGLDVIDQHWREYLRQRAKEYSLRE